MLASGEKMGVARISRWAIEGARYINYALAPMAIEEAATLFLRLPAVLTCWQ